MCKPLSRPLLAAAMVLAGCGGEPTPPPPSRDGSTSAVPAQQAEPSSKSQEVRQISASGLPIGDYLPPLDEGRITLATPTGWNTLPRDSKYVVRFYKDDKNGLPRIEVLAEDKSPAGLETVTEQNLPQFAEAVAAELQAQGKQLVESVLPMMVGSTPCARYVLKVELKMPQGSVVAERQTVVTLRNRRLYTVQLLVLPNKLVADRDAAYAICAGMKF